MMYCNLEVPFSPEHHLLVAVIQSSHVSVLAPKD